MGRQSSRKAWRRREQERFLGSVAPQVSQWEQDGTPVRVRHNHGPKMSQVLLDFIQPLLHGGETIEQYKMAVALGTLAWNAALLPAAERGQVLNDALTAIDVNTRQGVRTILELLIDRKLADFADEKRLIASYEVSESGSSRYVQVASLS